MSRATDVAWAAGLFEGEGCITITGGVQARLALTSVDEDTVRRFHETVGVGTIRLDEWQAKNKGWKVQYQWIVGNKKDVKAVLKLLKPYLGERRTARMQEILAFIAARPGKGYRSDLAK